MEGSSKIEKVTNQMFLFGLLVISPSSPSSAGPLPTETTTEYPTASFQPSRALSAYPTLHSIVENLPTASAAETLPDPDDHPESAVNSVLIVAIVLLALLTIILYRCFRDRIDEDDNQEYTRAILGDDAFEFSQMEVL
jgi:hypothetical protein